MFTPRSSLNNTVVPEIRTEMTTGTQITRIVGGLIGSFYLVGVLTHDMTVSEVSERWTSHEFAFRSILALVLVSPLLAPSKVLRASGKIWRALFTLLLVDCLLFTWKVLSDTVWAFRHGEWTQKIAFPSFGLFFWFVLVVQIVAYMRTRGTTTGRTVPPSAGASGVQ